MPVAMRLRLDAVGIRASGAFARLERIGQGVAICGKRGDLGQPA
jgi:hypothetical protein